MSLFAHRARAAFRTYSDRCSGRLAAFQTFEYNLTQFAVECPKGASVPVEGDVPASCLKLLFEALSRLRPETKKEGTQMRVFLAAVFGFSILLSAQSVKDKKIGEIDKRIAELQKEIEGLQALKSVVSSGQLPESAINQIVVGSSAVAKPSSGTTRAPAFPGSNLAPTGQAAAMPPASTSPGAAGQQATPSGTPTGQTTASGQPIYTGPRGGRYHYSSSGKKVYERKK